MRKRREDDALDPEAEAMPSGPVNFRREVRGGSPRERISNRRKASTSRRKTVKPGGIHQRANKRTNW